MNDIKLSNNHGYKNVRKWEGVNRKAQLAIDSVRRNGVHQGAQVGRLEMDQSGHTHVCFVTLSQSSLKEIAAILLQIAEEPEYESEQEKS